MVESYLHKMAKELLYKEIEEKSGFEYKLSNGTEGFESLISREDYRSECVLMEFPTKEGYYPDEFGCNEDNRICHLDKYGCDPVTLDCRNPGLPGYRFKTKNNTCKCTDCESYNFNDSIVHDIAAFWKGNVGWAIEILNKHEPDWTRVYASMPYDIHFVKADHVLKRVDSTPVFVYKIIRTCYPE